MHKLKVTLGKYWVEAFCCYFFDMKVLKPLFFPSEGIFPLESCDSVWKTGWFVSIFVSSSFGIPILITARMTAVLTITLPLQCLINPPAILLFLFVYTRIIDNDEEANNFFVITGGVFPLTSVLRREIASCLIEAFGFLLILSDYIGPKSINACTDPIL